MTKFRNSIHRRLLSCLMAVVMSATGMVSALTPIPALGQGDRGQKDTELRLAHRGHVAKDLDDEIKVHKKKKARWSREVDGVHTVQVLVSSDASDPQMVALRTEVVRLGGKVQVVHQNLRLLTVLLPAAGLATLTQHADVKAITPNRDTQSTGSMLESITGATATGMRTYSNTTTYSGFDGTGVGIAILDSGVMKAHMSFQDSKGVSRVKRSVNMLNAALYDWANPWDGTT